MELLMHLDIFVSEPEDLQQQTEMMKQQFHNNYVWYHIVKLLTHCRKGTRDFCSFLKKKSLGIPELSRQQVKREKENAFFIN